MCSTSDFKLRNNVGLRVLLVGMGRGRNCAVRSSGGRLHGADSVGL